MMPTLPSPSRWLLRRAVPPQRRAEVDADLEEVFRTTLARRGRVRATFRYWREVLGVLRWGVRTSHLPSAPREATMDGMLHDARHGLRSLWRNPAHSAVVIATLALGIGASTLIFTLVNGVLFTPVPIVQPDRVVVVREVTPQGDPTAASAANFVDWDTMAVDTFEGMSLISGWGPRLLGDEPLMLRGRQVTADFLDVLGIDPAAGRGFRAGEDEPGGDSVVVLGHSLWQDRFAGDPAVVGRDITLSTGTYTVVGVAPAELDRTGFRSQILKPVVLREGNWLEYRGRHNVSVIGRLHADVDVDTAQRRMDQIAARLAAEYPATNDGYGIELQRLGDSLIGTSARPLLMLGGAVSFVLLIACFNIASLALARGLSRRAELATYVALGASRRRVVRRLLVEGGVLAFAGGVLGTVVAAAGLEFALQLVPATLPRQEEIVLAPRVLLFAIGLTAATALVTGLLPAVRLSGRSSLASMAARPAQVSGARAEIRVGNAMMVIETALMIVSLAGAGLFLRSVVNLAQVDLGIDVAGVHRTDLYLPPDPYAEVERTRLAVADLVDGLAAEPGVRAAAAISTAPLTSQGMTFSFTIEGGDVSGPRGPQTSFRMVTPGYFEAVGIRLLEGRLLRAGDRFGAPRAVIVNEELAGRYWPSGDALGKRISYRDDDNDELIWDEIVGVVSNVRQLGPAAPPLPIVYQSMYQSEATWGWIGRFFSVVARDDGDPAATTEAMRRHIRRVIPDAPILAESSLSTGLARSTESTRFQARLLGVFGAIAALLAGVGFYGVLSFTVRQRMRELGLRLALGAEAAGLMRSVVAAGLRIFAFGAALGIAASLALQRTIDSLLFGVGGFDPLTYAAVIAAGAATAALASFVPAVRAARADPIVVLRDG